MTVTLAQAIIVADAAEMLHGCMKQFCDLHAPFDYPAWGSASDALRGMNYDSILRMMEHPYIDARTNHELWRRYAMDKGWRYGVMFDETMKINPWLLPFEALSSEIKVKSDLCVSVFRLYRDRLGIPERRGVTMNVFTGPVHLVQFDR